MSNLIEELRSAVDNCHEQWNPDLPALLRVAALALTPESESDSRKRFEAWIASCGFKTSRNEDAYEYSYVQLAWQAWQEAKR